MDDLTDDAGGAENLIAGNPSNAENLMFNDAAGGGEFWMPGDRAVNYVFPVEVVVVGVLTEGNYKEISKYVWNDFGEAWARQSA